MPGARPEVRKVHLTISLDVIRALSPRAAREGVSVSRLISAIAEDALQRALDPRQPLAQSLDNRDADGLARFLKASTDA
jgi:hypothetical protein